MLQYNIQGLHLDLFFYFIIVLEFGKFTEKVVWQLGQYTRDEYQNLQLIV